ncbi:hypothetical protein BH23BAC2_BH23BAC2_03430 [soil metagenome]
MMLKKAFQRLLSMGANEYEPINERVEGFITAAVIDPFGNILGIMQNPHYLEMGVKLNPMNNYGIAIFIMK